MGQRPINNAQDYAEYQADPLKWAQYGDDYDANGVKGGGTQLTGTTVGNVPNSAINAENAHIAMAPGKTAEARKKQNQDVNASKLASIFFREQNLSGGRQQQPDMLSEFLGL